jgi:hypothetical protein
LRLTATAIDTTATHGPVVNGDSLIEEIRQISIKTLEGLFQFGMIENVFHVFNRFIFSRVFTGSGFSTFSLPGGLLALLRACLSALLYKAIKQSMLIRLLYHKRRPYCPCFQIIEIFFLQEFSLHLFGKPRKNLRISGLQRLFSTNMIFQGV